MCVESAIYFIYIYTQKVNYKKKRKNYKKKKFQEKKISKKEKVLEHK